MVNGLERCGLTPVLKLFDSSMDVIDQGVNKRPSALAAYIEPWHADVLAFGNMKQVKGVEAMKTRRLFHGIMVNDLLFVHL